jgi:hypothetical protein
MKRIIKWLSRPVLWGSKPIRRAIMGRFDARVVRLVAVAFESRMMPPLVEALSASDSRLDRIEGLLSKADRSASKMLEEVDLVLNGLSREVFRLQAQVEMLRRDLDQQDRSVIGGLSLLSESADETRAPVSTERSRVG